VAKKLTPKELLDLELELAELEPEDGVFTVPTEPKPTPKKD